jgi:hypothetical protein
MLIFVCKYRLVDIGTHVHDLHVNGIVMETGHY